MAANPQTQAIAVANGYAAVAQQMITLFVQVQSLDAQWTDQAVATTLANLNTVALNADGTPGAADGVINVAHPISPTLYPSLQRLLSSNQYSSLKTIIDEIFSSTGYVAGGAVATQAGARAILNAATGG
jgi:hypothetical protein